MISDDDTSCLTCVYLYIQFDGLQEIADSLYDPFALLSFPFLSFFVLSSIGLITFYYVIYILFIYIISIY